MNPPQGIGVIISDSNALVTDVKANKTFYSNVPPKKTGTLPTKVIVAGAETYEEGYHAGDVGGLSAIDADLAVGNIKKDVNIFSKVGTYEGEVKTLTTALSEDLKESVALPADWIDIESVAVPAGACTVVMAVNATRSIVHDPERIDLRGLYNGVERLSFRAETDTHGKVYRWGGDCVGVAANAVLQGKWINDANRYCRYTVIFWYTA